MRATQGHHLRLPGGLRGVEAAGGDGGGHGRGGGGGHEGAGEAAAQEGAQVLMGVHQCVPSVMGLTASWVELGGFTAMGVCRIFGGPRSMSGTEGDDVAPGVQGAAWAEEQEHRQCGVL